MNKREMTLDEIKETELNILKRFDQICRDNGLEYSLAFGTMLGAVRHKGFIPWDDDIDVLMKRSDYEKLMKLKYEDEKYEIKSYRYSKNYFYPFSKMVDKSTYIFEDWRAEKDMGVYIDIFPLDYVNVQGTEEEIKQKLEKIKISADRWDTIAYMMGHKMMHHKAFSLRFITKFLFRLITFPFRKSIIRHADLLNAKEKNGNYCAMLLQLGAVQPFIKSDSFENTVYLDFEDFKAPVYAGYDYILTKQYGDYMTPPPPEKQNSIHWFKAYRKY
ncbi:MAG: phosphorylcholine transferase LicD [Eubacterium sp.]